MSDTPPNFCSTLEEAIDIAREVFWADHPEISGDEADIQQLNIQRYILQDGEEMWAAMFYDDETQADEQGVYIPTLFDSDAQRVFDGEVDEAELRLEWQEENTLYEWDEDDFQYEMPVNDEDEQTPVDGWSDE